MKKTIKIDKLNLLIEIGFIWIALLLTLLCILFEIPFVWTNYIFVPHAHWLGQLILLTVLGFQGVLIFILWGVPIVKIIDVLKKSKRYIANLEEE